MFIVFEGIDGSGKTTLSNRVAKALRGDGLKVEHVREAGKFASTVTQGIREFGRDARNLRMTAETEPLPGRFPSSLGPMPLLRESRLNHLGKLMFQWMYWHVLLPGRDIPGIAPQMQMAGKKQPVSTAK